MSLSMLSRRSCSLLLLAPWALTACGPSDEEIQKMVEARVGSLQQRLEEEKVIKTAAELEQQKAAEAVKAEWEKSLDVLAALDELMADYTPTLPEAKDNTDVLRCTTSDELASNAALAGAAKGLAQQKAASEQARREAAAEFEKGKWGQFAIDLDWKTRLVPHDAVAAVYGCWNKQTECWSYPAGAGWCGNTDGWYHNHLFDWDTKEECSDPSYQSWRPIRPGILPAIPACLSALRPTRRSPAPAPRGSVRARRPCSPDGR